MLQKFISGFLIISFFFLGVHNVYASSDLAITGSNSFSGTTGVAMPITDLQITGTTPSTTPVKLFATNGTLAMSTTTGLTFTGPSTGSTLYFSGTLSNLNTALATLTYTRVGTGTDTLEVSLVNSGEVFFPSNGHLYKFITSTTTWNSAQTAATSQTAYGVNGYLATITSQQENDFISARMVADGWIGASDSATEGDWKWVTGPETGTSFYPVGGYSNWNSGEPNDSGGNEDCAEYYSGSGMWNDLPCSGNTLSGYVAEFGAPGNLPTVVAKNISITTLSAPSVTTLSPTDDSTNINPTANLVMTFSQTVTAGTGNILIKKTSDNSTVESIPVNGGLVTGSGTNTITINPSSNLLDSTSYYINVPNTAFYNVGNAYYIGILNSTTWNFTTGDYTAPTITSITSSTANGSYKAGSTIIATVNFSEPVTSTGSVTLTFETGVVDRTCTFTVTSSSTGSCVYTAMSGDTTNDLDVSFVSGTIRDISANTNILTNFVPTSTLASTKSIIIDTTAPVLTQVTAIAPRVYTTTNPVYYFSATESGTYNLQNCSADINASAGTVSFSNLILGQYYSCTLQLTDAAGNQSEILSMGTFFVASLGSGYGVVSVVPVAISTKGEALPKLDFILNDNKKTTKSADVSIEFNGDPKKVSDYIISTDPSFKNEILHPYIPNKKISYKLPKVPGTYTLYMRYYSTTGTPSEIIKHTVVYNGESSNTSSVDASKSTNSIFNSVPKYGDKNSQVKILQEFLNNHGAPISTTGKGSIGKETSIFDIKTLNAVKVYQKSRNIIPANGLIGPKTLKAINEDKLI